MNTELKTGLLIVTHDQIGQALVHNAKIILDQKNLNIQIIEAPADCEEHSVKEKISTAISSLDQGHGVLILNDIYGATPFNIAQQAIASTPTAQLLSGLNLCMLLRAITYQHLPVDELIEKAREGGVNGVRYADKLKTDSK